MKIFVVIPVVPDLVRPGVLATQQRGGEVVRWDGMMARSI